MSLAMAIAVLALGVADAAVLCARRNGAIRLRDATCKRNETAVDPTAIGLQGPPGPPGPVGVAIAYGRVDGMQALGGDGLLPGAVGITGAERLVDTTYVSQYRLTFSPGRFASTPFIFVVTESESGATSEDNLCLVEEPSPTGAVIACSDLLGNADRQRPDPTGFAVFAVGAP